MLLLSFFLLVPVSILQAQSAADFIYHDAVNSYFDPVVESEILKLEALSGSVANYRAGNLRAVASDIERLKSLQLPDGRLDLYYFMLGECYRKLDLNLADSNYAALLKYYPNSRYRAQAQFRLMESAYHAESYGLLDSLYNRFLQNDAKHPLSAAATYTLMKSKVKRQQCQELTNISKMISAKSPYSDPANFLQALCFIELNVLDSAEMKLKVISTNTTNSDLKNESLLLLGAVYFLKEDKEGALQYYSKVDLNSPSGPLSLLRRAEVHISDKNYKQAIALCNPLVKNPDYIFESSLLLMDCYTAMHDSLKNQEIRENLGLFALLTRLFFQIEEEKLLVQNVGRGWANLISYDINHLSAQHLKELESLREKRRHTGEVLEIKLSSLKKRLDPTGTLSKRIKVGGFLERRFLEITQAKKKSLEDSLQQLKAQQNTAIQASSRLDSLQVELIHLEKLESELQALNQEQVGLNVETQNVQAKYVDFGFIRYQRLKSTYQDIYKQLSELEEKKAELKVMQTPAKKKWKKSDPEKDADFQSGELK